MTTGAPVWKMGRSSASTLVASAWNSGRDDQSCWSIARRTRSGTLVGPGYLEEMTATGVRVQGAHGGPLEE